MGRPASIPDPRVTECADLPRDLSWEERIKRIAQVFPAVSHLDWAKVFENDINIMGRILGDVAKYDQAVPGRPGPRPSLDKAKAQPLVDEWFGREAADRPYTNLPFKDAFRLLMGKRSLTQIARKIGISRTQTYRLLQGIIEPDLDTIRLVAEAVDKRPSYFMEFRNSVLVATMVKELGTKPDLAIRYYEALFAA